MVKWGVNVLCSHLFFSSPFLQLIRWTPQVAVCWPVCVWVRGRRHIQFFPHFAFQFPKLHHRQLMDFLYCCRRKKAALRAWHPLEAKKSRRRKFSSASWVPRVWASAFPAVQPRNLVSTSVTSSQAPFLQKLDLRWFLQMTRTPLWNSETCIFACCELHLCLIPKSRLETRLWRWTGWILLIRTTKRCILLHLIIHLQYWQL